MPVKRVCAILRCSRTAFCRAQAVADGPTQVDTDAPVITALQVIVSQRGRWGFLKCFDRLRALRHAWNHKRVYRVYRALRLNDTWAMHFIGDSLYSVRAYRRFNALGEGNHEALAIEMNLSFPSARVIAVLEQLCTLYGRPRKLR